jgi:zinc protease
MDATRVGVRSLRRNTPAAFDILADVVLNPSFPAEEIERQRGQRLAALAQQREDPRAMLEKALSAALYGPKHPYGYVEIGTEASNQAMTRDQFLAFWKQNFVPNNAALIVAGEINAEDLRKLAEEKFGGWAPGTPAVPQLESPETTSAKVVLVDKAGAGQTALRLATIGVPRSTPDYPSLEVMNSALGGLFSSRINLNLREEKGYTYGAGSVFRYRRSAGPFLIGAAVRTDATGASVTEMFKEMEGMVSSPPVGDELSLARDSLVRSLPGEFETSGRVVGSYSAVYVFDLGLDYFTKYPQQIGAVTAENVSDVAKRYLVPEKMIVVAVGDRAQIEPQLKALKLGKMEIRDADGNSKQ